MSNAIRQTIVFEAQGTNIPREVYDEVRDLWMNNYFGNDNYYYSWTEWDFAAADEVKAGNSGFYDRGYPAIAAFLRDQGVTECLIHWWW